MKKTILILLFVCSFTLAQVADRISGSPYPVSSIPDTLYEVGDNNFYSGQLLTIGTLQGLLAKTKPRIYRVSSPTYQYWLDDLEEMYDVTVIGDYRSDFEGLVNHFNDEIDGYVLCTLAGNSVSVAISLSGILNAVAVSGDYKDYMDSIGLPMLMDVRDKDEKWFFENYGDQYNKDILCFQKESNLQFLADYAAFGNMISFYNNSFTTWTDEIMNSFNPSAALLGWGFDEYGLVDKASDYGIYIHAADFANNLSTLSNFEVSTKQKEPIREFRDRDSAHYVCFLMTDGDNIQWDLGTFSTDSKWYGSSKRGSVSVGWTMSPAMSELAPTVLKRFYDNAAVTQDGSDCFVAGPSGVGYIFHEKFKDLDKFAGQTNAFMKKADLRIVNLLGNSSKEEYLEPFVEQDNIDAIFLYFYSNYAGGYGRITWLNGKPVITGRHQLWQPGFENSISLAQKLNEASRDVHSEDAYSLIPVHVWSQSMDDVIDCANRLDSNVIVLAPDEFVKMIYKNLMPKTPLLNFIPNNNDTEQRFLLHEYQGSGYDSLSRWADSTDKMIYKFNKSELSGIADLSEDLILETIVANEFIVSVTPSLNDSLTMIARWRERDTHIHGGWNKTSVRIELSSYFNDGWDDVYVVFEDGLPEDAFGPLITGFTLLGSTIVSVDEETAAAPESFELHQNYPNPFNPDTIISWQLADKNHVSLKVYNVIGQEVTELVDEYQTAGNHTIAFNALSGNLNLPSGIYFYKLSAGDNVQVRKMVLLK